MRKNITLWIIFAILSGGAIFWWTTAKKKIVRNAVTQLVRKKTDSLYKITYDTSEIDEVSGDAFLRNVKISLDSSQWLKLIQKDSMPEITISLTIDKITVKGLKELKLLGSSLDVSAIILEHPVFRLDKWARKKQGEVLNDTLEIYKRLVGNFNLLKAAQIQLVNGNFMFVNQVQKDSMTASGINISIEDFLVDSQHNYRNILSYFVKQTNATVNRFSSSFARSGRIEYNSHAHFLNLDNVVTSAKSGFPMIVKSISMLGLSADSFVYRGLINARTVLIKEPYITFNNSTKKAAKSTGNIPVGTADSFVVQRGTFDIKDKKNNSFVISDANVLLRHVRSDKGDIPLVDYLNTNSCVFTIGSILIPMGPHTMRLKDLAFPKGSGEIRAVRMDLTPNFTREQLKMQIGKQIDMYELHATRIVFTNGDLKKLIRDNTIHMDKLQMQMDLRVFGDKTIPTDSANSGSGKFPYEKMQTIKTKIDVGAVELVNSKIAYEEKSSGSGKNGTVFFSDVNGTVTNIVNLPEKLSRNNVMKVDVAAKLMGNAFFTSKWNLLLNTPDAPFHVTGSVSPFAASILNQPFETMAMMAIRSGFANRLNFEINGSHDGTAGTVLLNYDDLKIDLLRKNKEDSLTKKGLVSFFANVDIRNKNHSDQPRSFKLKKKKDQSFFNLLWSSLAEGAKNTILIVK